MSTDSTTPAQAHSVADFCFELPPELIAQSPLPERSASRLLVVSGDHRQHRHISELPQLLARGDHLVFNDSRVVPARLFGRKASGGHVELMLERMRPNGRALVKLRASKSPGIGSRLLFGTAAEAVATQAGDKASGNRASGNEASRNEASGNEASGNRASGNESGASGKARVRPSSKAAISSGAKAGASLCVEVTGRVDDLFELVGTTPDDNLGAYLDAHGEIPLPPYIERTPGPEDLERYQTVYAREPGAVAAPTAGLHFDEALLSALTSAGITHSFVTLHVGAGTFQPVRVADTASHVMHSERLFVPHETVEAIAAARQQGGRIIAVGTTSVRALESAAQAHGGQLAPHCGETRLFLTPGSRFHVIDALLTNFHLPESTLLMLVAAFAGFDATLAAYREAVEERYRFFSYGDAMLVWPEAHR